MQRYGTGTIGRSDFVSTQHSVSSVSAKMSKSTSRFFQPINTQKYSCLNRYHLHKGLNINPNISSGTYQIVSTLVMNKDRRIHQNVLVCK